MNLSDISDQKLIERFVEGERQCMEELIRRYKRNVYSYILVSVKNTHVADDLFQETFVKVINSLKAGTYSDRGKFNSWIIRIARNIVIDHFRRGKNIGTYTDYGDEEAILNSEKYSTDNIEDKIVEEQLFSDVRQLLELLPPEQKEIVLLRHYSGMSFKDIAETTNVSINTALGRMRYAIINLRKLARQKNIILTE